MSRALGGARVTSRSRMRMVPLVTASRPATIRSVVDFPQPDGPTMTTNSPSPIFNESLGIITVAPYAFATLSISTPGKASSQTRRAPRSRKQRCLDASAKVQRTMAIRIGRYGSVDTDRDSRDHPAGSEDQCNRPVPYARGASGARICSAAVPGPPLRTRRPEDSGTTDRGPALRTNPRS